MHGVLGLLRAHPKQAAETLMLTDVPSTKVKQFYQPDLSDEGTNARLLEEVIVYNFYRFLDIV